MIISPLQTKPPALLWVGSSLECKIEMMLPIIVGYAFGLYCLVQQGRGKLKLRALDPITVIICLANGLLEIHNYA